MTHVVLPIIAAAALPYLLTLASKAGNFSREQNRQTRIWQSQLTGWRQRAYWAHQNSFEAFPIFAAFVILAYLAQPTNVIAAYAAWTFIALRAAYAAAYIADQGALRSAIWFCASAPLLVLVLLALRVI